MGTQGATVVLVPVRSEPHEPLATSVTAANRRFDRHRFHRHVALALTTLCLVATVIGGTPSPHVSLIVGAVAVALGMPHGALDVAIGPRLMHWWVFFPGYGLLFAVTVAAWFAAPLVSLGVFLSLSWFHFGTGDASGWDLSPRLRSVRALATGGVVLGGPMACHAAVVAPLFTALQLGRREVPAATVHSWGLAMLAVAGPAALLTTAKHLLARQWSGAAEILLLVAVATSASPLITFAVYFAFWHSPRHLIEVRPTRQSLAATSVATALTLVGAFVVWWSLRPSFDSAVQVVFIGLAALTVPHLVVTMAVRNDGSA